MDRKSLVILLVCFAFFGVWYQFTNFLFPPHRVVRTNTVSQATSNIPAASTGTNGAVISSARPVSALDAGVTKTNIPNEPEQTLVMENAEARYLFTSIGGGIRDIELKKYPKTVGCVQGRTAPTNELAALNTHTPVPSFAILSPEAGGPESGFKLVKSNGMVRAERMVSPGVALIKEYRLSTNYLVKVSMRYENRTTNSIRLPERELVIGTATPMSHHDESLTLGMQWFNGVRSEAINETWFANRSLGCLPGSPRTIFQAGASNVIWSAVNNRFFTMIAVPEPGPAYQVISRRVFLPPPTAKEIAEDSAVQRIPFGYQTGFLLPTVNIPAENAYQLQYDLYAGPKEYRTLSLLPKDMDQAMGFGRWFGFFAKALLLSMNGLHSLGVAYGLAIILITVIIKSVFWPLTMASTRSMKRMSALQPQIKAIQAKYKDDPSKMNMKVMEFMKENKVNPLGGCLPMVLQIPVFIGFYQMLQSAIELRGEHFLWACDLSQPDTIFYIGTFPVNPLPIIMGATMLWQASLTPPSPGIDPAQQKIMRYMPLMMAVFLYKFQAGLTLYWAVQNLLSIAQMKLTKAKPEGASTTKTTSHGQIKPKKH